MLRARDETGQHASPTWAWPAWVPTGQCPVCQQEQQPKNNSAAGCCLLTSRESSSTSSSTPLESLNLDAEPINGDRPRPLPLTALQRSALDTRAPRLLVARPVVPRPCREKQTEQHGACIVIPDHRHGAARRGGEAGGDGAAARCVRELGLLRGRCSAWMEN